MSIWRPGVFAYLLLTLRCRSADSLLFDLVFVFFAIFGGFFRGNPVLEVSGIRDRGREGSRKHDQIRTIFDRIDLLPHFLSGLKPVPFFWLLFIARYF